MRRDPRSSKSVCEGPVSITIAAPRRSSGIKGSKAKVHLSVRDLPKTQHFSHIHIAFVPSWTPGRWPFLHHMDLNHIAGVTSVSQWGVSARNGRRPAAYQV